MRLLSAILFAALSFSAQAASVSVEKAIARVGRKSGFIAPSAECLASGG